MLSLHVVTEIKRLLDEGGLSQRQIAKRLGVARGTVQAIASGRRGLHGREQSAAADAPDDAKPPERCGGCGMLVQMPCVYCRARQYAERRKRLGPSESGNRAA